MLDLDKEKLAEPRATHRTQIHVRRALLHNSATHAWTVPVPILYLETRLLVRCYVLQSAKTPLSSKLAMHAASSIGFSVGCVVLGPWGAQIATNNCMQFWHGTGRRGQTSRNEQKKYFLPVSGPWSRCKRLYGSLWV